MIAISKEQSYAELSAAMNRIYSEAWEWVVISPAEDDTPIANAPTSGWVQKIMSLAPMDYVLTEF
jgi:hypothetical protein